MSQCVPSWDLEDTSLPSLDLCEVAELTWNNGQLALHGLCPPRLAAKPVPAEPGWDKPRAAAGTLESIVNQAATLKAAAGETKANAIPPWFDRAHPGAAVAMDALVPCTRDHVMEPAGGGESTRVGSCSGATVPVSRAGGGSESTATCGRLRDTGRRETSERELLDGGWCTSDSVWSQENTSSGREYGRTTSGEDRDYSVSHRTPQEEADDVVRKRKEIGGIKASVSTKRSRSAAVHSQSDRRRRDRINQRMKALQKMVPNSSKYLVQGSMLEEYMKQMQAEVQVMRMNMSHMMTAITMMQLQQQQYLHTLAWPFMGMGVLDFNTLGRATATATATAAAGVPPFAPPPGMPAFFPPPTFMPMPGASSWDIQAMNVDAYARLAPLYHQFHQPFASNKND